MEEKENPINKSEFFENFLTFTKEAITFQSGRVDDQPEVLKDLIERLVEIGVDINNIKAYDEVYWTYYELWDDQFDQLVDDKDIRNIGLFFYFDEKTTNDTFTLYVYEFFKVKKPRRRKTINELQDDLKDALKSEDYTKAAKIRDKIRRRELSNVKKKKK